MIPYSRHAIDEDDVSAVAEVLRGDWITQGPTVGAFEEELAGKVGARFAVTFSSGTAALHAAAAAAGLGSSDVVATAALSFVATANCARYVGARVTFVDIEDETLNIDLTRVPSGIAALIACHFAGLPVDLRRLRDRPRIVIEDAAHALGAITPDGPVGNCANSEMCAFSFGPVKSITTAEGGAVTTNSESLAERLRRFRNHGMIRTPQRGEWTYEVHETGFNYKLSDIHSALGRSQLLKLEKFIARREDLARRYDLLLSRLPVRLPSACPPETRHARHLYPVRVANRSRVFTDLRDSGIGVQVHYEPIHHHPAFADQSLDLPRTEAAYAELLSLPLFPGLRNDEQDVVVDALEASMSRR